MLMMLDYQPAGELKKRGRESDEEKNKKARVSLAKSTNVFFQSPLIMEKCTQVVLESEFTVFKESHQEKKSMMQCRAYDGEHLDTKLLELPCFAEGWL